MRTCAYLLFKAQNVGTDVRGIMHVRQSREDLVMMAGDMHMRQSRKDILIMAGDIHAREPKKDGSRQKLLQKAQVCEGLTFYEFSYTQAQKHRRAIRRT